MQIQVNSDSSVAVDSEMLQFVESTANKALKRFEERITRVEVHLSDVSGDKVGVQGKRCLMEARPASHEPVAVTNQADGLEEAVRGGAQKLKRRLDSLFGRLGDRA